MSYTKSGAFLWAGGGKAGATVDLWAASRFTTPPAENANPPDANPPDAGPVTTGTNFGSPGAYTITGITAYTDYYIRVQYGGVSYWGECSAGSLAGFASGTGWTTISAFTHGWSQNGSSPTRWQIINNVVYGEVNITGGSLSQVAFQLPSAAYPSSAVFFPIVTNVSPFVSYALISVNGSFEPLGTGYSSISTSFSYSLG